MGASYRGPRATPRSWMLVLALPAFALLGGDPPREEIFVGFITDTECGPDHSTMRARGGMGANDKQCTLACVAKGATFGFVDANRHFFQLDEQELPRPFAGEKVRVAGRIDGDTILVTSISAAD